MGWRILTIGVRDRRYLHEEGFSTFSDYSRNMRLRTISSGVEITFLNLKLIRDQHTARGQECNEGASRGEEA